MPLRPARIGRAGVPLRRATDHNPLGAGRYLAGVVAGPSLMVRQLVASTCPRTGGETRTSPGQGDAACGWLVLGLTR